MSTTTFATPPHYAVRDLAQDWAAIACHEMGHALAALAFNIPLDRVWIDYRFDAHLDPEWSVCGRTELVPDEGTKLTTVNDNESAPFTLAGLEAEVRWLHRHNGGSLDRSRQAVWDREIYREPDGDITQLELYLSDADFSRQQIEARTNDLLDRFWADLTRAADVLAQERELSARQLRGLLPELGDWRLR